MKKPMTLLALLCLLAVLCLTACGQEPEPAPEPEPDQTDTVDYSQPENWACYESGREGLDADVFFVCPTVYGGEEPSNMPLDDADALGAFLGATNMEKGIYDDNARFFAPYYRQAGLPVYTVTAEEAEPYLVRAYDDVRYAFEYYLEKENNGRPIVLAGFSQGADHCIRLMKDYGNTEVADRIVACYAIGWRLTEEETRENPWLKPAASAEDLGVIVAFNSEAEAVTDSLLIPEGVKTFAINPLNWTDDGTPADRSLNLGACFTDYSGAILREIPAFTGAYLDDVRGALKGTDVAPDDYPAVLDIFSPGVYHLYDYQFFYRNLEQNVQDRISAFLG